MKVPLAGQHENISEQQDIGRESPSSQGNVGGSQPIFESAQQRPSPSPPPPPDSPGIFRFFPFVIGLLVVGLIIFFAIRFVLPRFSQQKGPAELTYWGLWEDEAILDTIIKDYQRENADVKITYQRQNSKQYRETLISRLSKEGGPDIFRFHNTWVPMLRDFLSPIPSSIYTNEEFQNTFYPVAQKDLQVGNAYVGIPLEIDTLALFINEEDFQKAGLLPPKTWDELRNIVPKLTEKDTNNRIQKAAIALGTFDNVDGASDILALMMLQAGVNFKMVDKSTTRDGKSNLGEDVLTFYTLFAQGDGKVWDDTLDPSTLAFAKGKLSMYFGYSWRIFEIKALNPSFQFKVVAVPQLSGGATKTFASYWVEGISKKSGYQKEAFAFLKYLSTKETMQKLYSEQSKLRQFGEPYSRMDLADTLKNHEYLSAIIEQAKDATSWYLASNTNDNGLNDQMIKYFADAIRGVSSGAISPKTALETAAKGVEQVSTQYGL